MFAPASLRAFWRDRGSIPVFLFDEEAIGAGLTETLVDYTVPANRSVVLDFARFGMHLGSTLPTGEFLRITVIVDDPSPVIVLFEITRMQNVEGPGTVIFPYRGRMQLSEGYRFRVQGAASAGYADGTVLLTVIGTEYDI